MRTQKLEGIRLSGICSCVPARSEDCLARCTAVYGDAARAESIVRTTGIRSRRVLDAGVSALDLCVKAAETVLAETGTAAADVGAVVFVTFTPDRLMPCGACVAQARLGLGRDTIAFDLNLACSGWLYGVYVAGLLAKATGRKTLLLDGDAQTARLDPGDPATVPLLSDAGTATLVEPTDGAADPLVFAFLADGSKGDALQLPFGGTIRMDGFAVFRFVTTDVLRFIREFLDETGLESARIDAFVPHQANVFIVEQVAKKLGLAEKVKKSADALGNSSSASVPTTIAYAKARGRLLVAGFGGGLSAAVADLTLPAESKLSLIDFL